MNISSHDSEIPQDEIPQEDGLNSKAPRDKGNVGTHPKSLIFTTQVKEAPLVLYHIKRKWGG